MTASSVRPPDIQQTVGPLIPSLRAAAVSLQPPESVLPFLTPILRQRVQLLSSSSSNDPWIRLLCYETSKVPKLTEIAQGERLEPHPASGEIEIDWDYDVEIQFRRLDEETLQAFVVTKELELAFRLVYCKIDDEVDSWKVGEVTVADTSSPFSSFGGVSTIAEAERKFSESKQAKSAAISTKAGGFLSVQSRQKTDDESDEEDDDDYWARYDATPGPKTPDPKRLSTPQVPRNWDASNEDEYFERYGDVQPAMDNHDPDEEANVDISPPLGLRSRAIDATPNERGEGSAPKYEIQDPWVEQNPSSSSPPHSRIGHETIFHPCPRSTSSASSHQSVEKLEAVAARQEQNDFGVKQHVSRSIKSLFMLCRASGIDREEFERLVKTELDTLCFLED
ncbi:hypothetical protein GGS21DRAFT_513968 [Xylaria nigripes]|nr:hypothetical protein GGS21DRAFT_513968 [Xylaria nigripes]